MHSEQDVWPERRWDELLELSRRRGTWLRRRRQLSVGAPSLAVLILLVALPWSVLNAGQRPDALVTDVARSPAPAPRTSDAPGPELVTPEDAQRPAATSSGAGQQAVRAPQRPPVTARRTEQPLPIASPAYAAPQDAVAAQPQDDIVVAFTDARGDAEPTGGHAAAAGAESDATRDIVAMRFAAGRTGVHVVMELLEQRAPDGLYYGWLSDSATGCELAVFLGQPEDDGFYVYCDGRVHSEYIPVPRLDDVDARVLQAVIPYDAFPAAVSPHRALTLSGQTYLRHPAMGSIPIDKATTGTTLSRRPA